MGILAVMGKGDGGGTGIESQRLGLVDLHYEDDAEVISMLKEDLREIISGLMASPGDGFLRWMSKHLQASLGLDVAFIGELSGEDRSRMQTLEVCRLGETSDNFAYDLKHTPCLDVLERGICYCSSGVAEAYPDDQLLVDMGMESYVGISLFDAAGEPLGIAVLLHSDPISEEVGRAAAAQLRVYRPRMEAELSYRRAVRTMEIADSEALSAQSTLSAELRRRELERERAALERNFMHAKCNESIGELAGGIAHDFNNLLFAISGQVHVLQCTREDDTSLCEQLQTILDASTEASGLCEQLLTYAGRRSSDVSTIDLNQVIRKCQRVATLLATNKADLITKLQTCALPIVGSETRLQQVVMSLVKNAADATARGGTIRIETTIRERSGQDFEAATVGASLGAGTYATLCITVDGHIVDKEQLHKAFEPVLASKGSGSHLGLAELCGSIEEQGGALEIASNLGLGSTFTISFPLVDTKYFGEAGEAGEAGDATSAVEPIEGQQILVIDDDCLVSKTIVAILVNQGMHATLAGSGAEGISIFCELHQRLDAVILDYTMPEMNGDKVLIALRAISRAVPILMASGNVGPAQVATFVEKPDSFITKPFTPELLLEELRLLTTEPGVALGGEGYARLSPVPS